MSEENKRIARAYFEALDAEKSPPAAVCAPDFVLHIAGYPDMDIVTAKTFTKDLVSAVPDLHHPIVELVAEGDKVCYRGRYEGMQTGSYLGSNRRAVGCRPPVWACSASLMARWPRCGSGRTP